MDNPLKMRNVCRERIEDDKEIFYNLREKRNTKRERVQNSVGIKTK